MGYAGMYYHWASGFNLTPNRWYDSRTGRWLSRDPIAENGGTNLYNYVGGNVLNYTDPSGEFAIPVGQCLVGAGAVIGGGPLGWILGGLIIADAVVGSILNNSSDSGGDGDKGGDKEKGRDKVPPYDGPPNGHIEGPNRGRQYGPDGKPKYDIDYGHQGHRDPHVHEWNNGQREHPGRPVSPWPPKK